MKGSADQPGHRHSPILRLASPTVWVEEAENLTDMDVGVPPYPDRGKDFPLPRAFPPNLATDAAE